MYGSHPFSFPLIFGTDDAGDGLRHFAYQKEERFYGDVTLGDIADPKNKKIGIQGKYCRSEIEGY